MKATLKNTTATEVKKEVFGDCNYLVLGLHLFSTDRVEAVGIPFETLKEDNDLRDLLFGWSTHYMQFKAVKKTTRAILNALGTKAQLLASFSTNEIINYPINGNAGNKFEYVLIDYFKGSKHASLKDDKERKIDLMLTATYNGVIRQSTRRAQVKTSLKLDGKSPSITNK